MSIPAAMRYLYLRRDQERRSCSDKTHVREQCDRPDLEVPPANGTSVHIPPRTRFGRVFGWASFLSKSLWGIAAYGMPTGWEFPPEWYGTAATCFPHQTFFASMFVVWKWYSGPTDSPPSFAEQTHGNAKTLRTVISPGLLAIARWWGCLKMCIVVFALMMVYWNGYHWAFGREGIQTTVAPGPTDTLPPTAGAQPTGAGVEESSHPSTEPKVVSIDEAEVEMPIRICDNTPAKVCPVQPCEASRVLLQGCSRQQLAGCVCREGELGRFVRLEDDQNLNRAEQPDAYLFAKHGKEYAMLVNNKRCSRPGCWRRGILWGNMESGRWNVRRTCKILSKTRHRS